MGRVRADQQQLEAALTGTVDEHHRPLLQEHLTQIDHLERAIERVTAEIARRFIPPTPPEDGPSVPEKAQGRTDLLPLSEPLSPSVPEEVLSWAQTVVLFYSIPGISERAAYGILAEIGIDMQPFPNAGHLASWAGVVRCITRLNIPGAARKNSKGGSWVNGLPHAERSWGTVACHRRRLRTDPARPAQYGES